VRPPLAVGPSTLPVDERGRAARRPHGALDQVVRYTDALPSMMAFEIEIHELCHAVAALQTIDDPCHAENNGLIQTSRRR